MHLIALMIAATLLCGLGGALLVQALMTAQIAHVFASSKDRWIGFVIAIPYAVSGVGCFFIAYLILPLRIVVLP